MLTENVETVFRRTELGDADLGYIRHCTTVPSGQAVETTNQPICPADVKNNDCVEPIDQYPSNDNVNGVNSEAKIKDGIADDLVSIQCLVAEAIPRGEQISLHSSEVTAAEQSNVGDSDAGQSDGCQLTMPKNSELIESETDISNQTETNKMTTHPAILAPDIVMSFPSKETTDVSQDYDASATSKQVLIVTPVAVISNNTPDDTKNHTITLTSFAGDGSQESRVSTVLCILCIAGN